MVYKKTENPDGSMSQHIKGIYKDEELKSEATHKKILLVQKGFAMDDERLKQGGSRYFRELLQRIRDIRSSELY